MGMVVGWRRDHAGSQPLNINMEPSFAKEAQITPIVDLMEVSVKCGRSISKTRLTLDPGPKAFMIRPVPIPVRIPNWRILGWPS